MHFLYMDEKYADTKLPRAARITALTGLVVPADGHRRFRERFYSLLNRVVASPDGTIPTMPIIHAADLLPEQDDAAKHQFFEGIVSIVLDLEFSIYRVGYRTTKELLSMFSGSESEIVRLSFLGILSCLKERLKSDTIWPVMESDNTPAQDRGFAGMLQNFDYLRTHLPDTAFSLDNSNLGEVLYSTKRSAYGAVVDCVAYILHAQSIQNLGAELTGFKSRLADLATMLEPKIAFNEDVTFTIGAPPPGYEPNGPICYGQKITPRD